MNVTVMYLEVAAQAFISWFVEHSQQIAGQKPGPQGCGMLYVWPAQAQINRAYDEYMLTMTGVYQPHHQPLTHFPHVLSLSVRPVGRGQTSVVRLACPEPIFEPYCEEALASLQSTWPDATPVQLKSVAQESGGFINQLRLNGGLDEFERELQHFTSRYQAIDVEYVYVQERKGDWLESKRYLGFHDQGIVRKTERSWVVQIHLPTEDQSLPGIRDIPVEIKATQLGGQYPLLLEIGFRVPLYRESFHFCRVFLTHCLGLWNSVPADFAHLAQALRADLNSKAGWLWTDLDLSVAETTTAIAAPKPPAALLQPEQNRPIPQIVPGAVSPQPEAAPVDPTIPAWESIPDHLWDRQALKLWWEGRSCPYIGKAIHQSSKTVLNRLSTLRKLYGTDIVPMNDQRKERDTWM